MRFLQSIQDAQSDPQQMEMLYQNAHLENAAAEFTVDITDCYNANRDNLLLAAWYYRLQTAPPGKVEPARQPVNWKLAIPLAVINGLAYWILSGEQFSFSRNHMPYLGLLWAPLASLLILVYLTQTSGKEHRRALWIGSGLAVVTAFTFIMVGLIGVKYNEHYQIIGALHLALLSWVSVGVFVLGLKSSATQRFAFLIRSLEVFITGGVYIIVGSMFAMITSLLFEALSINLDDVFIRLIFAGGGGLIPLLAVVTIYDPHCQPLEQDFKQGLSRFTATMMRLLLPLTLIVLIVYIFVIPFNFWEPFGNRDVLIIYNVMLFAVMGLLIGATPIFADNITPKVSRWLAQGIFAVAILTVLISLYAFSATLYRTFTAEITMNRLTIIGWNSINIALLITAIVKILRGKRDEWVERIKSVFSQGTLAYTLWAIFVLVVIPLLFRS